MTSGNMLAATWTSKKDRPMRAQSAVNATTSTIATAIPYWTPRHARAR